MDYFAALRSFVRAVDLGSFSAAAAELGGKVSTISRHVGALEQDLGAALLNRSSRRLHLTEAGSAFYARACRILADVDDARAATRDLNAHPQGLLRATVPAAFGRRHVMPHMAEFLALYPDIRLDMALEDRTVDLIEAGMDVALRIGALADSTLVARRLGPHRRCPMASPAWLAGQPAIHEPGDLARLEGLSFALQSGAAWYCRPIDKPRQPYQAIPVVGRLRVNDSDALLQAAVAGLGVALLPEWMAWQEIRKGTLVALLPDWHWAISTGPEPSIWGVYPPKKTLSPKVRVFLDFMSTKINSDAFRSSSMAG